MRTYSWFFVEIKEFPQIVILSVNFTLISLHLNILNFT